VTSPVSLLRPKPRQRDVALRSPPKLPRVGIARAKLEIDYSALRGPFTAQNIRERTEILKA
jgi:hypothetical protein